MFVESTTKNRAVKKAVSARQIKNTFRLPKILERNPETSDTRRGFCEAGFPPQRQRSFDGVHRPVLQEPAAGPAENQGAQVLYLRNFAGGNSELYSQQDPISDRPSVDQGNLYPGD